MFQFLRRQERVKVLKDSEAFWRYANATQRIRHTLDGPASDAEERLDLRAGEQIKALLEELVGPEEGENKVQMQNWDWNDDRCRAVSILRSSFNPDVIPRLQSLLVGEFADFQILVLLLEDWRSDTWGLLQISATELAVQRNVAQAYAIAA